MAGNPTHGREGVLYNGTDTNSTGTGTEIGWTNSWSWSPSKDMTEITAINQTSKYYVEGLVGGTLSAEGSLITGDSAHPQKTLIGRFAKTLYDTGDTVSDTDASAVEDGDLYLHCILKPIDTGGSSEDVRGQKLIVPVLASGMSLDVSGGDIVGWSYEGTQDGDALYIESTSTSYGIPKKIT